MGNHSFVNATLQVSFYALNFYRRRYRGIGRASSLSTNTEPCGGRPQSEAWHDIKWFLKFVGLSLDYVTVPKAMVSKFKLIKLPHSDFGVAAKPGRQRLSSTQA